MGDSRWSRATGTIGAVVALGCSGGAARTPAASPPVRAPARTEAPAAAATSGSGALGETAAFGVNVLRVTYGPDQAAYEFARPAYVTVISVTDDLISAITPGPGSRSEIVGTGTRVVGLNPLLDVTGDPATARIAHAGDVAVTPSNATVGDVQEYNRCLARARQISASRRAVRAPIIGRDSAGRPIYGPPPLLDNPGEDYERMCRYPTSSRPEMNPPTTARNAKDGRYLLIFASDTPVEHRDILDLVITAGDGRSIATSIGRKLFDMRGARWSVTYLPW